MTLTIDGRAIDGRRDAPRSSKSPGRTASSCPRSATIPASNPTPPAASASSRSRDGRASSRPAARPPRKAWTSAPSTPELQALRRGILELILAEHPHACLICAEKTSCDDFKSTIRKTGEVTGCVLCPANGRCELQRVVEAMGLDVVPFPSHRRPGEVRRDDPFIDRDNSLCILCGRCVRVCQEIRGASVLTFVSRGSETVDRHGPRPAAARFRLSVLRRLRRCLPDRDRSRTGPSRYDRLAEAETKVVCPLCGQGCGLNVGLEGRPDRWAPRPTRKGPSTAARPASGAGSWSGPPFTIPAGCSSRSSGRTARSGRPPGTRPWTLAADRLAALRPRRGRRLRFGPELVRGPLRPAQVRRRSPEGAGRRRPLGRLRGGGPARARPGRGPGRCR